MSDPFQNPQGKIGRPMPEWLAAAAASGFEKHAEIEDKRLVEWGGMCSHKVNVASVGEVDDELAGW